MFTVSKLLTAVTQPAFWLALWWLLALLLLSRRRELATAMLWAGLVLLGLLGFRAVPDALLRPLETRYPVPGAESLTRYAGVIVLGGALGSSDLFRAHDQVPLNEAAERMTVPLTMLRQYPKMVLVFSGGEGRLLPTGVSEAELARAFFREQGIDPHRLLFESRSRNTRENAREVAVLLGPRCREPWLLLTSAAHLPRAMAEFSAVPCTVTPYPVDYRTSASTPLSDYSLAKSLVTWQNALHEWLGLLMVRLVR